jgi:glycosyltransferase involved in cell wall biosynthesis
MTDPERYSPVTRGVGVLILTFNEEKHIARCINSVRPLASRILVVDSHSTDRTVQIARELGARVLCNHWINYATQFNWGLKQMGAECRWVMRIDADEYVPPALAAEINERLDNLPSDVSGIYLKRRGYFMGQWIKHGGYYPTLLLRIWRNGVGKCEERWMDEHIKLSSGNTVTFDHDLIDDNLNDLTWWTNKHNGYATREAIDLLNLRYGFLKYDGLDTSQRGDQDKRRRWLKESVYARMPLGFRAFVYFLYRYIIRFGFLDGARGTIFHVLQGFWYRFLVDAKVFEIEAKMKARGTDVRTVLREDYGINI